MIDPSATNPTADVGLAGGGMAGRRVDATASSADRTYTTFIHLMLPIATATVLPMVLGPLVMWLIKKNESSFIGDHGKEALNFNLSILIYLILSALAGVVTCGIGFFVMPLVWVFAIIFSIIAALAANRGEFYRYPACFRIIG